MIFMSKSCQSLIRTCIKNASISFNTKNVPSLSKICHENGLNSFRHIHSNVNRVLLRPQKDNGNFRSQERLKGARSTLYYVAAAGVLTLGLSYASVPLYRMFCQVKVRNTSIHTI